MRHGIGMITLALLVLIAGGAAAAPDTEQAVTQLAAQVAQAIPEERGIKIAVTDFVDGQGVTSDYGRRVAHLLILRLGHDRKLMPIEWNVLGVVLSGLQLKRADLANLDNARRLRKEFGADIVVVGALTDLGDTLSLEARVVDIASGETLGFASAAAAKDRKALRMLQTGRE